MKTIVLFAIATITLKNPAKAQDSLHINAGFLFAPQAGINLKKTDGVKGFDPFWRLHMTVSVSKKRWTGLVLFTLNTTAIAPVVAYQFSKETGMYLIYSKRLLEEGSYLGAGFTLAVAEGRASAFAEFGSSLVASSPALYIGVLMPLTIRIK